MWIGFYLESPSIMRIELSERDVGVHHFLRQPNHGEARVIKFKILIEGTRAILLLIMEYIHYLRDCVTFASDLFLFLA